MPAAGGHLFEISGDLDRAGAVRYLVFVDGVEGLFSCVGKELVCVDETAAEMLVDHHVVLWSGAKGELVQDLAERVCERFLARVRMRR